MEISPQIAETMIMERFREHPQMKAVAESDSFKETLTQILDYENINQSLSSRIETEVIIVLTLYAPISELAQNIQESTGLSPRVSESITTLIETLILQPVYDELIAYSQLWQDQLAKEILTSQPPLQQTTPPPTTPEPPLPPVREVAPPQASILGAAPLTREAVLQSLTQKRTLAHDVENLQKKDVSPVVGYDAYVESQNQTNPDRPS